VRAGRNARWRRDGVVDVRFQRERNPGEQALKEPLIFWFFRGSILGLAAQSQQNREFGLISTQESARSRPLQVPCTSVTLDAIGDWLVSYDELAVLDADSRSQPPESHQNDLERT